jgi:hypothetical protein
MRLTPIIMTLLLGAGLLVAADEKEKEKLPEKTEAFEATIIPVKTLSGDSFNRLVRMLNVFHARFSADDRLRTIIIYAPKDVVTQMRRVIEQLDQPGSEAAIGRNVELTLSFLRCYINAPEATTALPAELEAVAKQIRTATQYKTVQLWDVVPLHLQEGRVTEHSFRLPKLPSIPNALPTARMVIAPEAVTRKADGRYVRFSELNIMFRLPFATGSIQLPGSQSNALVSTQYQFNDFQLKTAGDFKEGQKAVLGKVSGIDDESAIFVVIALKIQD